jgi:hypothetical protein
LSYKNTVANSSDVKAKEGIVLEEVLTALTENLDVRISFAQQPAGQRSLSSNAIRLPLSNVQAKRNTVKKDDSLSCLSRLHPDLHMDFGPGTNKRVRLSL